MNTCAIGCTVNLLPEEKRSANSRMLFVPSAILAALVLLVAGAVFGYSRIGERHYLAMLEAESAKLQPQVKRIAALDKSLDQARARTRLLDEFRIEVPIVPWPVPSAEPFAGTRRLIRVSAALHNGPDDVDRLAAALTALGGHHGDEMQAPIVADRP